MTIDTKAPAVILRPMPFASQEDAVAGFFGGTPIMPEALEWPRNLHGTQMMFLGQVDLALLDCKAGQPTGGSLFFFWDVEGGGETTRVLYAPVGSGPAAISAVPAGAPNLAPPCDRLIAPEGLCEKGKVLRKLWIEALPFQSAPAGKHGASGLEAILGRAAYPNIDYTFPWLINHDPGVQSKPEGMLKKLIGRVRKPTPKQLEEGYGLNTATGEFAVPASFPWLWSVVEDVAAQVKELATLGERHLYDFWNGDAPVLLHLWKDAPAQAEQWIARASHDDVVLSEQEADAFRAWLDQLANAALHVQVHPSPDPLTVAACKPMLAVLENEPHKMNTYPDGDVTPAHQAAKDLVPLLACIKEYVPAMEGRTYDEEFEGVYWSEDRTPVPYYEEWDAWYVPRKRLAEALADATRRLTQRLWRYGPDQELPADLRTIADWDILRQTTLPALDGEDRNPDDDVRVPIQMFGHGQFLPEASQETADKVMLLQISDGFGLPFEMDSRVLHIWIDPQDLAEGRFEAAFTTVD